MIVVKKQMKVIARQTMKPAGKIQTAMMPIIIGGHD